MRRFSGTLPRALLIAAALVVGAWASVAPPAGAAEETESAASVRADPASERLRYVIVGLVGLGGVLLVGTARFWWVTRPALVGVSDSRHARSSRAVAEPGAPARIPAAVVLAGPLTTPSVTAAPPIVSTTPPLPTDGENVAGDADGGVELDAIPPPSGAPALLAPPPVLVAPESVGVEHPLVGDDSVWLIGDEPPAPEPSPEPTAFAPEAGDVAEAAPVETPPATATLIAALAALPDHSGSRVEFDDPPVERVVSRARVEPADPAPEPELVVEPDLEHDAQPDLVVEPDVELEPEIVLDGAPNYDRIARDTAEVSAVLVDVPPVGMFYDQDLDPGDPPGRDG